MIYIKEDFKNKTYKDSALVAAVGLKKVLKAEKNFKTHAIIGTICLILDKALGMNLNQLSLVFIAASNVFVAEIFNTAVEKLCNLITKDYNEEVKFIKDIAAGGVLLSGIAFFLVQVIILGGAFF